MSDPMRLRKVFTALAAISASASACAVGNGGGFVPPSSDAGSPPTLDLGHEPAHCHDDNDVDDDHDGWSERQGDCDDCARGVNPGAYDFPGNGVDEDCSGTADDERASCDDGLALDDADPFHAAMAIGLCARPTDNYRRWGVLSARWVRPDGTGEIDPLSYGVLSQFGVNRPQEGASFLALSTGTARAPDMPGYQDILGYKKGYTSGTPQGYPKESPACPGVKTGAAFDGAGLELEIRVPTNVGSFHVQESFFTLEFPGYVCSKYNDFFILDMTPHATGYPDGNVAFDSAGNPISVNNSLLQVCRPQTIGGRAFACPLGPALLTGTGFDVVQDEFSPAPHGATGWLTTRAPVVPGSVITLRFAIWDSADGNLDSTTLLDGFGWSLETAGDTRPSAPLK